MAFEATIASARETMDYREIWYLAVDSFRANKVRFALTALGMVIGTASLILVVTIGLTGKQFILGQIQGIGANMIYAYYEAGGNSTLNTLQADALTVDDMNAVRIDVPGIIAASPMLEMHTRITVTGGKEREVLVLGVSPEYRTIRNLLVTDGRFFDQQDSQGRDKVAMVTPTLATKLYRQPFRRNRTDAHTREVRHSPSSACSRSAPRHSVSLRLRKTPSSFLTRWAATLPRRTR